MQRRCWPGRRRLGIVGPPRGCHDERRRDSQSARREAGARIELTRVRKADAALREATQQPVSALRGGGTTRGDARGEPARREVTRKPAGENKRRMVGRRRRLRVERHWRDKNGAKSFDATTCRGKREGRAKASATEVGGHPFRGLSAVSFEDHSCLLSTPNTLDWCCGLQKTSWV